MKILEPFNPEQFLILVVDDMRKNLQLLIEILDTYGYGTTFALSGKQALERVKMTEPDLILLDLIMPEINGIEVCKKLKEDENTAQIPVIFLTAASESNYLLNAFKAGAVDYVTKPFRTPELLARIKIHLDLKRTKDELEKAYEEMKRIAATDELTGIPNRRSIFNFGKQEFSLSKRYNSPFSVLMIDVDKFKTINDTHGHDIGDEALKMMVNVTLNCLRKVDYIGRLKTEEEALKQQARLAQLETLTQQSDLEAHLGRLGGEEFVVVLPQTDLKGAYIAAQRVCKAMPKESLLVKKTLPLHTIPIIGLVLREINPMAGILFFYPTVKITVSIGVATYDPKDEKMDDLLKRADLALFAAKENGRNQVAIMHNDKLKLSQ
ncbi:diguanylate cyclase [Crocosphaera sp.]|uniref:GGDEF domain-containing response regulator n=1 Tax=Crocosphaera sp. TaxID=2729996 RepID=UPI0026186B8E|nr:diguanylate cyclase [Crocosphaera sp.]MDJ0582359.1 diguanylate cyclase [Crocosphaera sp.]